jgi:aminopeptidase N
MEEAHGESLHWFFDQWLHRPGYPVYRADWHWNERAQRAEVTIHQEQDESWPTFLMPVELEFALADGGTHRVIHWVDGREWPRNIGLPGPPTGLRLDPDGWLLMRRAEER